MLFFEDWHLAMKSTRIGMAQMKMNPQHCSVYKQLMIVILFPKIVCWRDSLQIKVLNHSYGVHILWISHVRTVDSLIFLSTNFPVLRKKTILLLFDMVALPMSTIMPIENVNFYS